MNNNLLIIILVIIGLFLLSMCYQHNIKKQLIDYDNYNIENFDSNDNKHNYDLISNNSFQDGLNLKQFINQDGFNKIIKFKNPGQSPYVLNQKKNSYYEISCNNSVNNNYILYFYLYVDGKVEEFDIEKFIQIRMPTQDYNNYIPKIQYNIIKKTDIGTKKPWYYIKVNYFASNNVLDKQIIRFNNNQKDCSIYFTDVSLYKVLANAPNFIYNNQLICFIDAIHYQSNNNILHDLSGNNNDMYLSNIPKQNEDYIELGNTKIEGFPSNELNSDSFTINLVLNKQENNNSIDSKVEGNLKTDTIFNKILLSICGNNNYAFELGIENDYLYLLQGKNKIKSNKQLTYYNKSMITCMYDGTTMNIFCDNLNIISSKINKLYMSKKPIILNKNKNLNMFLYSFLVYNTLVDIQELKDIRNYFITNLNKNKNNSPNTLDVQFDDVFKNNNTKNPFVKPFDKKIEKFGTISEETFQETYNNTDEEMKSNCLTDCNDLCKKFLNGTEVSIDNYKKCIQNCKNVLSTCDSYCKDSSNQNSVYCSSNIGELPSCPKVVKKNGNYVVYIPPNSQYSNFYTGERVFSNDIDKARNMYAFNFPECPIPSELVQNNNNESIEKCPFVINELNPCNTRACSDVNWNVKNYKDLKMNDKCKKIISNYCHINYAQDENCKCWDPKYKNDPNCIQFRKFFENPNDYCSPSSYNIEEHPDFNKYIKKDNIPCWGCKIPE